MTGRKIRWHRYADHMGRTISVRATQNRAGDWVEHWTTENLMRADFARGDDEPDTSPQPVVAYRSASKRSQGPQHRGTISNRPKSHSRKDRRR